MTTEQQIKVLRASIDTIKYKIKNLSVHVSPLQRRMWVKHKRSLNKSLSGLINVQKQEKRNATTQPQPNDRQISN
jgi:hypothetical protein